MNQIIMTLMAIGAVLGGLDRCLGNRFGLGQKFEEGFQLMGSIGLSMAGITCLTPVIADLLGRLIIPVFTALGIDPSMFGSILAIDTGGYQLAMELTVDPRVGRFAGVVAASIFGCTIVFTIPFGMRTMGQEDRRYFAGGLLIGLVTMPPALLVGGLLSGLSLGETLWQCLPLLLISALLLAGLWKIPDALIRGFTKFARGIQIVTTLGLTLGAFQYLTGWELLPSLTPLEEAMALVSSIAIAMLGCLPLMELVQRILKKPLEALGRRTGMNPTATTGLLVGIVTALPALVMIKDMDKRGNVVCGAFLVCGASAFSAHLGFTLGVEPEMVLPLLASKLQGAALALAVALWLTGAKRFTL